jgi:hypothetical protein
LIWLTDQPCKRQSFVAKLDISVGDFRFKLDLLGLDRDKIELRALADSQLGFG